MCQRNVLTQMTARKGLSMKNYLPAFAYLDKELGAWVSDRTNALNETRYRSDQQIGPCPIIGSRGIELFSCDLYVDKRSDTKNE